MTTPWQMNCEHQESGWCLECVGKLHDELTQLQDVAIKAFYCIAATRVMQPTETIQAKYSFTNPTDANELEAAYQLLWGVWHDQLHSQDGNK